MTTTTDSNLVLVDSTGWIEFAGEGPRADQFAAYVGLHERTVMPTIVIYEVTKKLLQTRGDEITNRFLSSALRCIVVDLDESLSQAAAKASLQHQLPMADSIIYVTAQMYSAQVITSDSHFEGLSGVTLI